MFLFLMGNSFIRDVQKKMSTGTHFLSSGLFCTIPVNKTVANIQMEDKYNVFHCIMLRTTTTENTKT